MSIAVYGKFPRGFRVGSQAYERPDTPYTWFGDETLVYGPRYSWKIAALCSSGISNVIDELYAKDAKGQYEHRSKARLVKVNDGEEDYTIATLGYDFLDDATRPVTLLSVLNTDHLSPDNAVDALQAQMSWDNVVTPTNFVTADLSDIDRETAREAARQLALTQLV